MRVTVCAGGLTCALGCGRREGDDGERGCEGRDDGESRAKHESSFREGFGFGGGRQVF
jgi:hypothetical protein